EKLTALEEERSTLLTTLLGAEWQSSYYPYPAHPNSPPLDGPVLGALPPRVKQVIRDAESRAAERRLAYLDAQQKEGKEPDPTELAKIRQQTRSEIGRASCRERVEHAGRAVVA